MERLQRRIIGVAFRAAAVEGFRALRVKRRFFLQASHQIRVGDVIAAKGHSINHFHEKLFLLRERMNTATGRALAEERHRFMEEFVQRFLAEWSSE